MSWLFAVSKALGRMGTVASSYHDTPLCTISLPGFYLAIGGSPDTSFYESNTETSSGWAVVGTGISILNSHASFLTRDDWGRLLTRKSFDAASLDGHFVALRWSNGGIECFTDQLGLRSVYFAEHDGEIYISTRLDWLARTTAKTEIDFSALGSRWLLLNQVSFESCVVGVGRLGPGGHVIFKAGSLVESTNTPWLPSFEPGTTGQALDVLKALSTCALDHRYTASLGLSGGLDSRFLLALLTDVRKTGFVTHSFGTHNDPDVWIAESISAALGLLHQRFDEPLPDVDTCILSMSSFVAQSTLTEPSTSFNKLRYYPKLREQGRLMIDGGFGEFARRRYLTRVVLLGRSALRSHDTSRLLPLLRSIRADIFSPEATGILNEGARQSLEVALEEMPPVEKVGVENFVDLFTVRMRVPNYGGPEQARVDAEILNFMPLVQPSYLRTVFQIPLSLRSNARFIRNTIGRLSPTLTRFPLAKAGFSYRYGLSNNAAWLVTKVKSKLSKGYSDPGPHQILDHLRDYVLDTAHSKEAMTNSMYDYSKVVNAVTKYYKGELHLRNTVDWWLTFELWRRSLASQNSQSAKRGSPNPDPYRILI